MSFACIQKRQSTFLEEFSVLGNYYLFYPKVFICPRAPVPPWMRKLTPSEFKWILARMRPMCRNSFVFSFLSPAAEWHQTLPACVRLTALLTLWDFLLAQGGTPHGSNSLCKQNLRQIRPPIKQQTTSCIPKHSQISFALHRLQRITRTAAFLCRSAHMPGALLTSSHRRFTKPLTRYWEAEIQKAIRRLNMLI